MPARSCRRSAPTPISASARGSRDASRRCSIGCGSAIRNDDALAAVDPASSVIFVINHRSNMDYVLVTYVASTSSALSYAVGEWAQVWGLRGLIRSMGAYFISRDSREALYRKVLARYVHMATAAGVTQAIFPEGGLSRDGRLRPPKFGLLSYMVAGFDPHRPARRRVHPGRGQLRPRAGRPHADLGGQYAEPGKKPVFGFNAADLRSPLLPPHLDGAARRVVSLRLYLRQFWRAGFAAQICHRAGDRFPHCLRRTLVMPRSRSWATS